MTLTIFFVPQGLGQDTQGLQSSAQCGDIYSVEIYTVPGQGFHFLRQMRVMSHYESMRIQICVTKTSKLTPV